MKLTLKIWRQKNAQDKGKLVEYKIDDVSPDMSFLEMLDVLNDQLIEKGEDPVAFDTIAVKVSVECAPFILMEKLTVPIVE